MKSNITSGFASIISLFKGERASMTAPISFTSEATGLIFTLAGSSGNIMVSAAHGMRTNDRIRFTSGNFIRQEFGITEIIDVNTFRISEKLKSLPANTDTFDHLRPISGLALASGAIVATSEPVRIKRGPNSVFSDAFVTKDTASDANTIGMPVEIVGAAGTTINLTAGDINVQTSHTGANPDSQQIGDGTEIMQINVSGEAQVRDDDLNTALTTLNAKDFSTQTTLAAVLAKIIAAPSTESKQDAANLLLTSLDGKDFSTEVTSAAILAKIIASPATEVKQDTIITSLASLLTAMTSGNLGDSKETVRNDYSVTPANLATDLTLVVSLSSAITSLEIFDSSGQTLMLKVNGVDKLLVSPGGNGSIKAFKANTTDSIEIRALSANANLGEIDINFFG